MGKCGYTKLLQNAVISCHIDSRLCILLKTARRILPYYHWVKNVKTLKDKWCPGRDLNPQHSA